LLPSGDISALSQHLIGRRQSFFGERAKRILIGIFVVKKLNAQSIATF